MSKLTKLQTKRAKIWQQAKDFLDEKHQESDVLSTEDNTTYEKMEADVVSLGKEIDRLTKQIELDNQLKQPTSQPLTTNPAIDKQGLVNGYSQDFWNLMRGQAPVTNAL